MHRHWSKHALTCHLRCRPPYLHGDLPRRLLRIQAASIRIETDDGGVTDIPSVGDGLLCGFDNVRGESSRRLEDVGYNDASVRLLDTGVHNGLNRDRGSVGIGFSSKSDKDITK